MALSAGELRTQISITDAAAIRQSVTGLLIFSTIAFIIHTF